MTADSAVRGIRASDSAGSICMVSNESVEPYNRPPLSKGLWHGKSIEKIWRKTEKQNIDLLLNSSAVRLDPKLKVAETDKNETIGYEKVLLATGASPRRFPFHTGEVNYFRYLKDYEALRSLADKKDDFTIIGGGFIGSELAASLSQLGKKVKIIFPEKWMGQRIYPVEISSYLHDLFKQHDVEIMTGISVSGIEDQGEKKVVHISKPDGSPLDILADGVIAGLGVIPETKLAQEAGLAVENGIKVNEFFQTAHPDIYAAGDVANYPDSILGKNRRVEHEDHANSSGMLAGKNMTGAGLPYDYLPYFYSDLFDIGYEAVGDLDSNLDITIDWQEPYKKGTLYYQRDSKIVGALFWNLWGKLDQARVLIKEKNSFSKEELKGLIT